MREIKLAVHVQPQDHVRDSIRDNDREWISHEFETNQERNHHEIVHGSRDDGKEPDEAKFGFTVQRSREEAFVQESLGRTQACVCKIKPRVACLDETRCTRSNMALIRMISQRPVKTP